MKTRILGAGILLAAAWVVAGCESPSGSGGLLDSKQSGAEKWTIWCQHTDGPDFQVQANTLSDLLRHAQGLRADKVRVVTTENGCTIYYGQYVKVVSPETGRLVFPPEYLRDLGAIQRTAYNGAQVFRYARPEMLDIAPSAGLEQWDVSHAKGKYTLQIGVFYNTPTFQNRKEAAEEYVKQLRQDGFAAYFRHEDARSFVFVGDFDDSDVVKSESGKEQVGPRVERLIKQREDEFRHMLENGYRIRRRMDDGQMMEAPSQLIPLPGK